MLLYGVKSVCSREKTLPYRLVTDGESADQQHQRVHDHRLEQRSILSAQSSPGLYLLCNLDLLFIYFLCLLSTYRPSGGTVTVSFLLIVQGCCSENASANGIMPHASGLDHPFPGLFVPYF